MENTSFTTQQVSTVRCLQEPCTTFGIFLTFSSDLSWMLRLLLLLWFHSWPEKGLKDLPLSLCFFPCIAKESFPSQGRNLEQGVGWRETQWGFAGVQHSCTLRSSSGMEADEKRERGGKKRCGKNWSPALQRMSSRDQSAAPCSESSASHTGKGACAKCLENVAVLYSLDSVTNDCSKLK